MYEELNPLVQQHSARHGDHEGHEGWPPAFKSEVQHSGRQNDGDPFARAKLGDAFKDADKCRRQVSVEPESEAAVNATERIY